MAKENENLFNKESIVDKEVYQQAFKNVSEPKSTVSKLSPVGRIQRSKIIMVFSIGAAPAITGF